MNGISFPPTLFLLIFVCYLTYLPAVLYFIHHCLWYRIFWYIFVFVLDKYSLVLRQTVTHRLSYLFYLQALVVIALYAGLVHVCQVDTDY